MRFTILFFALSAVVLGGDTVDVYRPEIDRLNVRESERIYRAEDSLGNTILETDDYSIISKLKGIRLKIIPVPKKVIVLKDSADVVRNILMSKLGKPYKSEYYYTITWKTPTGGTVVLNKTPDSRPVMIVSYRGREWMRENMKSMRDIKEDTIRITRKETTPVIRKDTIADTSNITRGVPKWTQE